VIDRSIDHDKLSAWYSFQARFYHLWRDDYRGPLVAEVASLVGGAETALSVLDAGCGTGLFTIGLALARERWRVEGLDEAEGMLAMAKKQADKLGLERATFRQGDVTALPHADGSVDAVVAGGLLPNLNDRRPALNEFHRVLAPGGGLVIVEMDRAGMSRATRLFFRVMILGYKLFSSVLPRFRFARGWNVRKSTVDRETLMCDLLDAGFVERGTAPHGSHVILHYEKRR
jgi:ubiquinone/menaquinone biosynthesis C-methylase UbiE